MKTLVSLVVSEEVSRMAYILLFQILQYFMMDLYVPIFFSFFVQFGVVQISCEHSFDELSPHKPYSMEVLVN